MTHQRTQILLLAFMICAANAEAQQLQIDAASVAQRKWVQIKNLGAENEDFYVDPDSLRRVGQSVTLETLRDLKKERYIGQTGFMSQLQVHYFLCTPSQLSDRHHAQPYSVIFSENMGRGTATESSKATGYKKDNYAPSYTGFPKPARNAILAKYACGVIPLQQMEAEEAQAKCCSTDGSGRYNGQREQTNCAPTLEEFKKTQRGPMCGWVLSCSVAARTEFCWKQ